MSSPAGDPGRARGGDAYPGTPGWVKTFAIVGVALLLLFLIVFVLGSVLGLHHVPMPGGHGG